MMRKQWRYVGFYGEEVMLCAGVVRIGPFSQTFWSVWDRVSDGGEGRVFEHTKLRPGRAEVTMEGSRVEVRTGLVKASLRLGEIEPIEVVSPSGRGWGWTRKRAGVPVTGQIEADGRIFEVDGFGVDDESAGYHARHVAWFWSAGIGTSVDDRALGWNLVEGINDSETSSERSVWVDGVPREPGPVRFEGLEAVRFKGETGDPGLVFEFGGAERRRHDRLGPIRSDYVHRFGAFSGSLDGIPLASATGVMEDHKVAW
ncbi:MAG: DUF2804 family protein [Solirubrobacterales bacterium]|nr:DUF2804 family protein [Solirubrobacterales bacterium]MCB8914548.1 DUF2804 family protein [Thermoleophilales bacterium]